MSETYIEQLMGYALYQKTFVDNLYSDRKDVRFLLPTDAHTEASALFKGKLLPPQEAILAAMIEFATTKHLSNPVPNRFFADAERNFSNNKAPPVETRAEVVHVRAPPGSGKGVITLAYIATMNLERLYKGPITLLRDMLTQLNEEGGNAIVNCELDHNSDEYIRSLVAHRRTQTPLEKPPLREMYYGSVVMISKNTVSHWKHEIATFVPDLKVFYVESLDDLKSFQQLWIQGTIQDEYDFIVLVNFNFGKKTITRFDKEVETDVYIVHENDELHGQLVECKADLYLEPYPQFFATNSFKAFTDIIHGCAVANVFLDDGDTHEGYYDSTTPIAVNVFLVSATCNKNEIKKVPDLDFVSFGNEVGVERRVKAAESWTKWQLGPYTVTSTVNENNLKRWTISPHPEFIKKHMGTKPVSFFNITVRGGAVASAILQLSPVETPDAISAGAVRTAATELGIEANSMSSILRAIIDDMTEKIEMNKILVANVNKILELKIEFAENSRNNDVEAQLSRREYTEFELAELVRSHLICRADMERLAAKAKRALEYNESRFNDCRNKLLTYACSACEMEFGEMKSEYAYIMGCCQSILCESCAIIKKREGDKVTRAFVKNCPMFSCRKDVSSEKGRENIIAVGFTCDYTEAFKQKDVDDVIAAISQFDEEVAKSQAQTSEHDLFGSLRPEIREYIDDLEPKMRILLSVVVRKPTPEQLRGSKDIFRVATETPDLFKGLLAGIEGDDAPLPTANRSVAIYNTHLESNETIAEALKKLGVGYCMFHVNSGNDIDNMKNFLTWEPYSPNEYIVEGTLPVRVVLIDSLARCAGYDLSFVGSLVFYNRIASNDVAIQVAGRLARLNRKFNCDIYLLTHQYGESW